jgi:hypothetical protein
MFVSGAWLILLKRQLDFAASGLAILGDDLWVLEIIISLFMSDGIVVDR